MSSSPAKQRRVADGPDAVADSTESSLGLIPRSSLSGEAQRAIRAGIITGEIHPGEIYSASSLAAKLGVSATPVREALIGLANAGLVEPVKNRGFRVVVLDDQDLDEIFVLRTMLEVPSVGQVAGKLDAEQIQHLRVVLADLEHAAEVGDLIRFLSLDQEFHIGLLEPLRNRRLSELVRQLRDQQRLYGLAKAVHSAAFLDSSLEHREILSAVIDGDRRKAESLTRNHLKHTRGLWAGGDEPEASSSSWSEPL